MPRPSHLDVFRGPDRFDLFTGLSRQQPIVFLVETNDMHGKYQIIITEIQYISPDELRISGHLDGGSAPVSGTYNTEKKIGHLVVSWDKV